MHIRVGTHVVIHFLSSRRQTFCVRHLVVTEEEKSDEEETFGP